jgi:hypothetical protein
MRLEREFILGFLHENRIFPFPYVKNILQLLAAVIFAFVGLMQTGGDSHVKLFRAAEKSLSFLILVKKNF